MEKENNWDEPSLVVTRAARNISFNVRRIKVKFTLSRLEIIINLWFHSFKRRHLSVNPSWPLFVAQANRITELSFSPEFLHSFVSLLCFAYWKLFSRVFALFSQWLNIMELFWISLRLLLCKKVFFYIFCVSFDSCRPVQISFCFIHSPDDVM